MPDCTANELILRWEGPGCTARLNVDFDGRRATIDCDDSKMRRRWTIDESLLHAGESKGASNPDDLA